MRWLKFSPGGLGARELRLPSGVLKRPGLRASRWPSRSCQRSLSALAMSLAVAGTQSRQNNQCWAALVNTNLQMNFCQ